MISTIAVLEGDQTGQELLIEGLRVLNPDVTGVPVNFEHFDLSLDHRRATNNKIVYQAAEAMKKSGLGLKAATITPAIQGDVGSPNAILRDEVNGTVIVRTGRRIPGIRPCGGAYAPISVVRMAVGGAYGAQEFRQGSGLDEIAGRTEHITRRNCYAVAEFSFRHAQKLGVKVFGGPKFTVSPVYEGMLKEEMDDAAKRYPGVIYEPQLIDATYALLLTNAGDGMVIPSLNRDGDCLSDFVLQMFGSIAGAESLLLSFDDAWTPAVVMAEAPHGTAPSLQGKNIANPMAMILAGGALLRYIANPHAHRAARAIYEAVFEAVHHGMSTPDLGGSCTTTDFTDEIIRRVKAKLEVWESLGNGDYHG